MSTTDINLEAFLARNNLTKYLPIFVERSLSYNGIKFSEEGDLVEAGIPKSVERKVLVAIQAEEELKEQGGPPPVTVSLHKVAPYKSTLAGKDKAAKERVTLICNLCGCANEPLYEECADCGSEPDGTEETSGAINKQLSQVALSDAPTTPETEVQEEPVSSGVYECETCGAENSTIVPMCEVCEEPNPAHQVAKAQQSAAPIVAETAAADAALSSDSSSQDDERESYARELRGKLERLLEERDHFQAEIARIGALERERDQLDHRQIQIEEELAVAKEMRAEYQQEHNEAVEDTERRVADKQRQLDALSDSVQQMTSLVELMQEELAAVEDEGGDTENSLRERLSKIQSQLDTQQQQQRSKIQRMETRNQALSSARGLMQLMAELQEKRDAAKAVAEGKIGDLQQEVDMLQEEADGMAASNAQMRQAMSQAEATEGVSVADSLAAADLRNRGEHLRERAKTQKQEIAGGTALQTKLSAELKLQVARVSQLEKTLEPLLPELAQLEQQRDALEAQLAAKQAQGVTPEMASLLAKARAAGDRAEAAKQAEEKAAAVLSPIVTERDALLADIAKLESDESARSKQHSEEMASETAERDGIKQRDDDAIRVRNQYQQVLKASGFEDAEHIESPLLAASQIKKEAKNAAKELAVLESTIAEMMPVIAEMKETITAAEAKNVKKLAKGNRKLQEKSSAAGKLALELRQWEQKKGALQGELDELKAAKQ